MRYISRTSEMHKDRELVRPATPEAARQTSLQAGDTDTVGLHLHQRAVAEKGMAPPERADPVADPARAAQHHPLKHPAGQISAGALRWARTPLTDKERGELHRLRAAAASGGGAGLFACLSSLNASSKAAATADTPSDTQTANASQGNDAEGS